MSSKVFKISFEEIEEDTAPVEIPVDEKEVEELAQQEQLNVDIQELEEEIAYREDLVDGLTGLKTVAERVGTPTTTDVALFRVAANMAVAGTQENAQDFIPAIESNKPIQGKSFDSKIKALQGKIEILKLELVKLKGQKKISKEELAEVVPTEETPAEVPEVAAPAETPGVPEEGQTVATENWEVHLKNKLAVIKKLQGEIPHIKAKIAAEKKKKKK